MSALSRVDRPADAGFATRRTGRTRARTLVVAALAYAGLAFFAVTFVLPYYWLLSTSLKETGREFAYPPQWIPDPIVWQNYLDMWQLVPIGRWFLNTLVIVALNMVGGILSATLAGYAFARLRFPGRDPLFVICLATMM